MREVIARDCQPRLSRYARDAGRAVSLAGVEPSPEPKQLVSVLDIVREPNMKLYLSRSAFLGGLCDNIKGACTMKSVNFRSSSRSMDPPL